MAQVRIDLVGDANQLTTQIAGVVASIRDLQRSAADVYAMRGDAGMVGLQRQIQAANAELSSLKSQLQSLGTSTTSADIINQFQGIARAANSARESAAAFKTNSGSLGTIALGDNAARQADSIRYLDDVRQKSHAQEIAAIAKEQAAQSKALQDKARELNTYYKQQESLQREQLNFAQKLAPSQPIGTQREELKRQFDAGTASAERLKRVQDELIAKYNQIRAAGQQTFAEIGRQMAVTPTAFVGGQVTKLAGYDEAAGKFKEATGKAAEGIYEAADKVGFGLRHVVALFDEGMRGQRGAMVSSASAMLRDMGAIELVTANLASPWTAVGAAGVAAVGLIVAELVRAHARLVDIRDTAASMAAAGGGKPAGVTYESQAADQFERDRRASDEYQSSQIAVDEQLNKLTGTARGAREELENLAKSMKGLGWGDIAKDTEEVVKEANKGAEAFAKFLEEKYSLQGLKINGQDIEQVAKAAEDASGTGRQASIAFVDYFRPGVLAAGQAANIAQNQLVGTTMAMAAQVAAGVEVGEAYEGLGQKASEAVHPTQNLTNAVQDNTAAEMALGAMVTRLTGNLTAYGQAARDAAGALEALNNAQLNSRRDDPDPNRGRDIEAERNARANEARVPLGPADEQEHEKRLAQINEQAQARQADLTSQAQAATARREEAERVARLRPGQDTGTPEVINAKNAEAEAWRKVEDQKRQISEESIRAQIADEHRGADERITLMKQIIAIDTAAAQEGRESWAKVAQDKIQLAQQQRQVENQRFQEARDNARAEVELAKGNVAEIIAAYDKLKGVAVATGQTPAVGAQIDREKIRDLESAQSQSFAAETEYNSTLERLGTLQIATKKAQLAEEVAAHKMSKEQMASAEGDFTAKVMAENEKRIQSELENDNLTQTQKEKLYEHLAELYEKDAELQQQAQEKVTQAVEAENKKREAIFTKTFDAIGSAGEKAIEGLFNRGETHKQVLHKFLQESVKSIGTGAASELSDVGGEKIGPMLGLSKEESHGGIGQVLGESLFKALGLQKEAPEDHAKQASDKMKQAADAQSKAAELQNKASENLLAASKALQEFAGKHGVPSSYGGGGGGGGDGGAVGSVGHKAGTPTPDFTGTPAQAQAAVTYSLDATGEKLKAYCATLVNESLEKAGVKGSGSGLASSFGPGSSFGTPVSPDQVRAGDVFYKGSSGWGDTGHVGFTEGPVSGGQVPVMSSHMQGDPSNPAGSEYRSITGMTFRRPAYDESQTSQQNTVKLDPSSAQTVSQGVVTGEQQAAQTTQSAIDQGVQQGNSALISSNQTDKTAVDANKAALDKNTTSVDKNTTKISAPGGGGGGTGDSATGTSSALNVLKETTSAASSGLSILGGRFGAIGNAINRGMSGVTQLTSVVKSASEGFDLMDGTTKAVTTATTLEQGAKTLNATATATDTTAMQTNAAAAASSGGGGILGGLFKLFAFSGGGVVPSAAGGMMVGGGSGGTLSLLHPQEMVLPAHLSQGLQGMINRGGDNSSSNTVLNYNANVTGYHPYGNRSEFEGMLRSNSSAMMDFVRNEMRNGSYR